MIYGGRYGGQVDLTFSGAYTPPAANAVDLTFVIEDNTFAIQSKSQVQVVGYGIRFGTADYNIATFSTTSFLNAQRSVIISGESLLTAVTDLRAPEISAGTSAFITPGFRALADGSSDVYAPALAAIQASTTIAGTSSAALDWNVEFRAVAYAPGKTSISIDLAHNVDIQFFGQTKSSVTIVPRFTANVAGTATAGSVASPRAVGVVQSQFTTSTSSVGQFPTRAQHRVVFNGAGSSTVSAPSLLGMAWLLNLSSGSSTNFVSSYIYNTPLPTPSFDNVVFAKHKTKDIFTGVQQ